MKRPNHGEARRRCQAAPGGSFSTGPSPAAMLAPGAVLTTRDVTRAGPRRATHTTSAVATTASPAASPHQTPARPRDVSNPSHAASDSASA